MELHTAADGSQVLYAVLEDTNEIASFRVEGAGDSLRLVELSRVPTPGHAVTHVVFVRDDEGQGASSPPTTPTGTFACIR